MLKKENEEFYDDLFCIINPNNYCCNCGECLEELKQENHEVKL